MLFVVLFSTTVTESTVAVVKTSSELPLVHSDHKTERQEKSEEQNYLDESNFSLLFSNISFVKSKSYVQSKHHESVSFFESNVLLKHH